MHCDISCFSSATLLMSRSCKESDSVWVGFVSRA